MSLLDSDSLPAWNDSFIGKRVERSSNWDWNNQDGGPGNTGIILGKSSENWARVQWSNGHINAYPHSDIKFTSGDTEMRKRSIEFRMQKHIPGFFIGCNIECIKLPTTYGTLKIGTIVTTTEDLTRLENCIMSFDNRQSSINLEPSNKHRANYESGCFKAVENKSVGKPQNLKASLAELEMQMQRFIPGFYVGCELEVIKESPYSPTCVGQRFSTNGLTKDDLEKILDIFHQGHSTCRIDPNTAYSYRYSDLKVLKESKLYVDEVELTIRNTSRAEYVLKELLDKELPTTLSEVLISTGYIMPSSAGMQNSLQKESQDKPDSSFNIEFVDSQLHKPEKKSKIKF